MNCKHEETEFRRQRIGRDGSEKYYKTLQCIKCGRRLKNPGGGMWWKVDDGEDVKALPLYDADLENDTINAERELAKKNWRLEREKEAKIAQVEAEIKYQARHIAYESYIQGSSAWQDKRQDVLERCKGICEGCGKERATCVHHTNYDTLYNELLYSLKGLCSTCHKIAHRITEKS